MRILAIVVAFLLAWPISKSAAKMCLPGFCGYFYVKNECSHPIEFAIYYDELWEDWTVEGFYIVNPSEEIILDTIVHKWVHGVDNYGRDMWKSIGVRVPLRTNRSSYYYYARTTDGNKLTWGGGTEKGRKWITVNGERILFRKRTDIWNDVHLTLTCTNGKSKERTPGTGYGGVSGGGSHRL